MNIIEIPIESLISIDNNANEVTGQCFEQLEMSIKENGFMIPIVVASKEDKYIILDGNHRYEVAKNLGYKTVPCNVIQTTDFLKYNIIFNNTKGHVSTMKLREIISRLIEDGMSISKISEKFSIRSDYVKFYWDTRFCSRRLQQAIDKSSPEELIYLPMSFLRKDLDNLPGDMKYKMLTTNHTKGAYELGRAFLKSVLEYKEESLKLFDTKNIAETNGMVSVKELMKTMHSVENGHVLNLNKTINKVLKSRGMDSVEISQWQRSIMRDAFEIESAKMFENIKYHITKNRHKVQEEDVICQNQL